MNCPHCGAEVLAENPKFCNMCGNELKMALAPMPSESRRPPDTEHKAPQAKVPRGVSPSSLSARKRAPQKKILFTKFQWLLISAISVAILALIVTLMLLASDYERGQDAMEAKQWAEAVKYLSRVETDDADYSHAQALIKDARTEIARPTLSNAYSAFNRDDWSETIRLLKDFPRDIHISAKAESLSILARAKRDSHNYQTIQELVEGKQVDDAFRLLSLLPREEFSRYDDAKNLVDSGIIAKTKRWVVGVWQREVADYGATVVAKIVLHENGKYEAIFATNVYGSVEASSKLSYMEIGTYDVTVEGGKAIVETYCQKSDITEALGVQKKYVYRNSMLREYFDESKTYQRH